MSLPETTSARQSDAGRPKEPNRLCASMDVFAPWQVRRELELSANQLLVLMCMTMTADWRSLQWTGTITKLHQDTGIARSVVTKTVELLAASGAIVIVRPFGQNREGLVELPLYEALVKLSRRQHESRQSARPDVFAIAQQSRAIRESKERHSLTSPRNPCLSDDGAGIRQSGKRKGETFVRYEEALLLQDELHDGHNRSQREEVVDYMVFCEHTDDDIAPWPSDDDLNRWLADSDESAADIPADLPG